ncbi:hypothetical protein AVEN_73803-1 [Araneus ventricosus]|uniref:Uncharacterized protein n=1 Tax=Araneus ventricosus TaxID=182803 RepID=A0A4Y2HE07_ARAVE|nr:hypothetical protein AVEN_73803-1 [Araneus ventricosus]
MKCAELHKSKDCPKPRDAPPKCLYCNGAHTAIFTGCPKISINRKSLPAAPENYWLDLAVIAKVKASPIPTVEPIPTSLNSASQFIPDLCNLHPLQTLQLRKLFSNKCLI